MSLRLADQLSLGRIVPATEQAPPRAELVLNGSPTGKHLPGATLEAAIDWDGFYLLFLTDDVPYEEMLRIVLLDQHLNALDRALIGGIYSTGSFRGLELCAPNAVQFRFIGELTWRVELRANRSLRVPLLSEPRGVYRPLGFFRWFLVTAAPAPSPA